MHEIATLAWRHTSRRVGRTTLTVLGIAIGFGAIIAILSLSFGVNRSVEKSFDVIATDAIVIPIPREVYESGQVSNTPIRQPGRFPGAAGPGQVPFKRTRIEAGYIDSDTFEEIIQTEGVVNYTARSAPFSLQVVLGDRVIRLPTIAVDPDAERHLGQMVLEEGSWPGYMEALAGEILARTGRVSAGDQIEAITDNDETYNLTVSGLVSTRREARFGTLPNVPLLVDFDTAKVFTNQTRYSTIILTANSREDAKDLANLVQASHPNLTVLTFSDFTETIENTLNQYSVFLLSIGVLAVLVAALGSANTMVVSTMERTREIGIMKATGAKNDFILKGFLLESAILGLVGGVTGVIFGYLGSQILEYMVFKLNIARVGAAAGFSPYIPLWLIPFSIILAVLVTVISGSYPAVRASRLDPVEAIRYE